MDKTTAICNYNEESQLDFDNSEFFEDHGGDKTLPQFNDFTLNESQFYSPPQLEILGNICCLVFKKQVPVGSSCEAVVVISNSSNDTVEADFKFQEKNFEQRHITQNINQTTATEYNPLFPFSLISDEFSDKTQLNLENLRQKTLTFQPNEIKKLKVKYTPLEVGEHATILNIYEYNSNQTQKLEFRAKSGDMHLEMDILGIHLPMKPPCYLEPTSDILKKNDLNSTMVLDPVSYLGELDMSLRFDINLLIKNMGSVFVDSAKIFLKSEENCRFMELLGHNGQTTNSIKISLDSKENQKIKLRVRSKYKKNGQIYTCTQGIKSCHLVIIKSSDQTELYSHKFTAKIGTTKIKIPNSLHKVKFYKNDIKEITDIRNAGNVAVTLNISPPDSNIWQVTPKILTLAPNQSKSITIGYHPTQDNTNVTEFSKLKLSAQPNGYEVSILLQSIPIKFEDYQVDVNDLTFHNEHDKRRVKSAPQNGTPKQPISSKPPTVPRAIRANNNKLWGSKTWLIFEPCLAGSELKLNMTVQNPSDTNWKLEIKLDGLDKNNFDFKILNQSRIETPGKVNHDRPLTPLLAGKDLPFPIYYKPVEDSELHTAKLVIRSSSFKNEKFTVPIIGWTSNPHRGLDAMNYSQNSNSVFNVDKMRDYFCVMVYWEV